MASRSSRMNPAAVWAVFCALTLLVARGLWLAPLSPAWVEREYSATRYLTWQQFLTPLSNLAPIALFDALLIVAIVALIVSWWRRYRTARRSAGRWDRAGQW